MTVQCSDWQWQPGRSKKTERTGESSKNGATFGMEDTQPFIDLLLCMGPPLPPFIAIPSVRGIALPSLLSA